MWIGVAFAFLIGLFGVLAEPAVHVLVQQIETISEGTISKKTVLSVLAISIGLAVALHVIRAIFQFSILYYFYFFSFIFYFLLIIFKLLI